MRDGTVIVATRKAFPNRLRAFIRTRDNDEERCGLILELAAFICSGASAGGEREDWVMLTTAIRDPQRRAMLLMQLGASFEKANAFGEAAKVYGEAARLSSDDPDVRYFAQNNRGYSLNQLGDYAGGERHCREALLVDPSRPNAHKNLGLALQGQGRLVEAARAFIQAAVTCPRDTRAYRLLEQLLARHAFLCADAPTLAEDLLRCRAAMEGHAM
ncbi:MAG: tetratricopeptide repeat protein [Lentisphaerae bacterium]|nr:tetratricopeptide repeat protein [Lentisphaerota bacterium]